VKGVSLSFSTAFSTIGRVMSTFIALHLNSGTNARWMLSPASTMPSPTYTTWAS